MNRFEIKHEGKTYLVHNDCVIDNEIHTIFFPKPAGNYSTCSLGGVTGELTEKEARIWIEAYHDGIEAGRGEATREMLEKIKEMNSNLVPDCL